MSSSAKQPKYTWKKTNLIAPGSMVTSAAAMVVEALKVRESTILTDPPLNWVAFAVEKG